MEPRRDRLREFAVYCSRSKGIACSLIFVRPTRALPISERDIIPYVLELRDTTDAALHRLAQLEAASTDWMRLFDQWDASESVEPLAKLPPVQSRIFDEVEGFLAAFARVSYLLFPIKEVGQAKDRAVALRSRFGVSADSPLDSRDLRDSWVHFDERLDTAIAAGRGRAAQRYLLSRHVTPAIVAGTLRVFEVDTLQVHYWTREGAQKMADLRALGQALRKLFDGWRTAIRGPES